ncbi:MAG: L,D-transpeptidase family protein [Ahrensia sp.]|nr:L,D-transpeptidase family protein [Ahrensia sp.]
MILSHARTLTVVLALCAGFALNPAAAASPEAVSAALQSNSVTWAGRNFNTDRLRASYEARGHAPIWMSGTRLNKAGQQLVDEFAQSYRDGLEPGDYVAWVRGFTNVASSQEAAKLELALSHAFLTLARDLYSGLTTPSVTDPNIVIAPKKTDVRQWLDGAAAIGPKAMYVTLRPNHPQYAQLRSMLNGYRNLLLRGGWLPISEGPTLKPGMDEPRIGELRNNLGARGYDVLDTNQPDIFDDGLVDVVKHFQKRHGLDVDGAVGPATLRALNVSAQQRVDQLVINLERWRWLPRKLGRNHILVNQAGFELFMIADGKTVDRRRVIVGKPFHQSPMFSDEIVYAEFNPTWTVPTSIATKEMLPKIRNNPNYLDSKGYNLYRGWGANATPVSPYAVDWSTVSRRNFPFRIVQPPGPTNALGQVKFIFPNKFAVYLHDTPSRQLFSRTGRAFSHGCIRVEKPLEFAQKMFAQQGGLRPSRVGPIVESRKQTRVNLKQRLPVHLAYFTAWIDDGVPLFFEDVYERDRLVSKYLF